MEVEVHIVAADFKIPTKGQSKLPLGVNAPARRSWTKADQATTGVTTAKRRFLAATRFLLPSS
jgi:hypothetical protein